MQYQDYVNKPTAFLALTGYTHEEFAALLPHFEQRFEARMTTHQLTGKPRGKRRYSAYQNSPLPTSADKLFFILNYLKTHNLQEVQGALFGISQPQANQWIHCLHPLVHPALADVAALPAREMAAELFADDASTLYFHDGTARPILRPSDPEQQREYYSGKKNATRSKTT